MAQLILLLVTALVVVTALRLMGLLRPLGRSVPRRAPRVRRHQFPRLVTGRGPSRRVLRRQRHLKSHPASSLSSPKLGGLTLLLAEGQELERNVEKTLRSMEKGAEKLLSSHQASLQTLPERVESMGEERLARQVNRLRGVVGQEIPARLRAQTARRRARRRAHVRLKTRRAAEKIQAARVATWNRSVAAFAADHKPTEEWAADCLALWERHQAPRKRTRKTSPRCIEGTKAFEIAGRARTAQRIWGRHLRALPTTESETPRERLIRRGEIIPGTVEEKKTDDGEIRESLIARGVIGPAVVVTMGLGVAHAEAA